MKKLLAFCLFMLISLIPSLSYAGNGIDEEQAIAQLTSEITKVTS